MRPSYQESAWRIREYCTHPGVSGRRDRPARHSCTGSLRVAWGNHLHADKRWAFPHGPGARKPATALLDSGRDRHCLGRLWLHGGGTVQPRRRLGWTRRLFPGLLAHLDGGGQALRFRPGRIAVPGHLPADPGPRPVPERLHPGGYLRGRQHSARQPLYHPVHPASPLCDPSAERGGRQRGSGDAARRDPETLPVVLARLEEQPGSGRFRELYLDPHRIGLCAGRNPIALPVHGVVAGVFPPSHHHASFRRRHGHHPPLRPPGIRHEPASGAEDTRDLRFSGPGPGADPVLCTGGIPGDLERGRIHQPGPGRGEPDPAGGTVADLLEGDAASASAGDRQCVPADHHRIAGGLRESHHHRRRVRGSLHGNLFQHRGPLRSDPGGHARPDPAVLLPGGVSAAALLAGGTLLRHGHGQAALGPAHASAEGAGDRASCVLRLLVRLYRW